MKDNKDKGTGGKDKTTLATLAAFISCIIYGFSFMASRVALMHTAPEMLLAIRFSVAMIIMILLVAFGVYKVDLRGKPVGMFIAVGICQPVIYFIAETKGIQYTNSSFAGIMISLIPVITVVLSAVFLHETLKLSTLGWIMVSVAGVAVISTTQTSSGAVQLKGVLWLFAAVTSAAAFYILSRSIADKFTPFERTFVMMVTGCVFFVGKAIVQDGPDFVPMLRDGLTDRNVMVPILYLAVLSSVVAFMMQNYAVTYIDLAKTTVFENIIPVISVVAGVLLLGEPFSLWQLAGMVLILLGVWKVTTADNDARQQ